MLKLKAVSYDKMVELSIKLQIKLNCQIKYGLIIDYEVVIIDAVSHFFPIIKLYALVTNRAFL